MKVFVTGATGVLGRRVLPHLVQAGHTVTAVARSADKAAAVRAAGAVPVTVDLFDPAAVTAAVAGCDAVANLATKIPPPSRAAYPPAWAESTRLRSEASGILVDAALQAGVSRFVQESIAFIYRDSGQDWVDEDVALDPPPLGAANLAAEEAAARFTAGGGTGVVLRFGQFYAANSAHTRFMAGMVRRRLPAVPGPPHAYSPAVAAEDAASAVAAALTVGPGAWNVTDDRPLSRREFHEGLARLLGVRPPLVSGTAVLRWNRNAAFYLRSLRVSNRRFADATGWSPRYADALQGWTAMLPDLPP